MSTSFSFLLAVLPLISQVSAFGPCNSNIINNIKSSNLQAFDQPKTSQFAGKSFKYDYVSATDKNVIQSAQIIFEQEQPGNVLPSTFTRFLGSQKFEASTSITFTERGDKYGVDFQGFLDSEYSENQVYIFSLDGVVVAYYCSLGTTQTGLPLFTINTLIDDCTLTDAKVSNVQNKINELNNNVPVPLAKLSNPPLSPC